MRPAYIVTVVASVVAVACTGDRIPTSDAERLSHGRQLVEKMSAALGSAPSFSVTTREVRDKQPAARSSDHRKLTRQTMVRRPDRLYFKTDGDAQNEGWYDGVGLTLVAHQHKVFGQARLPETLDKALDALAERYGVWLPMSDLLHSSPSRALLSDKTTGGWVARDTVAGEALDHLAFKDTGVEWELWLTTSDPPLPRKLSVVQVRDKRKHSMTAEFADWNLSPSISADAFKPHVPGDYEGIAIIQRASVLKAES